MILKEVEVSLGTYLSQRGWFNAASSTSILGLDMALVSTGWATIVGGNLRVGYWAPTGFRCGALGWEAEKKIKEVLPNVVSVEDVTFQKSYESYQIGMGSGAILAEVEKYLARTTGTGLLKVHPTRLKYFALRKKEADKKDVQRMVYGILNQCGITPGDILPKAARQLGDVCDAVGLAVMGFVAYGINRGLIDPKSLGQNIDFFTTSDKNLCSMLRATTSPRE